MINSVFLLGTLASEIEVPFSDKEHQAVSARLCLREESADDRPHRTYVPRVAWGKAAEVLGDLAEGDTLVVKGKLRWVKRGKSGRLEYGLLESGQPHEDSHLLSLSPTVLKEGSIWRTYQSTGHC